MNWQSMAGVTSGWTGQDWGARPGDSARVDPYLVWADATAFDDLGGPPRGWVRVIIELAETVPDGGELAGNASGCNELTAQLFAERFDNMSEESNAWIRVPSLYRFPTLNLEKTRFLTAFVTGRFFDELDKSLKGFVKRFEIGLPVVPDDVRPPASDDDEALAHGCVPEFSPIVQMQDTQQKVENADTERHEVFVGVIDDGIAFAHQRFRTCDNPPDTRIEYFWNQDDRRHEPPGPSYGQELHKTDIDGWMKQCVHGELVDEDAVYEFVGYVDVRKRWAHGTEVLDLACGEPSHASGQGLTSQKGSPTQPPRRPRIICVQFKTAGRTIRDTSGLWFAVYALDALRYVLRRAHDAANGAPYSVVINLSYGYIAGPHDGSSIIERAIDELILASRHQLCVVVPAGNSNLARCHAQFSIAIDASRKINWRVLPDCATPSFLEIWLPPNADATRLTVQIRTPWHDDSPSIYLNDVYTWQPGRHVLCTVVYLDRVATGDRHMILIALAPTITDDPERDAAPGAAWEIWLANDGDAPLELNAWVQRNETAYGYPLRGRQSRFEDPKYARFDECGRDRDYDYGNERSWVKRDGTLSSVATGEHTVVIGAYRLSDGKAASYSATGPSAHKAGRDGPDATAVGDDSVARLGVLGASTRSGAVLALTGTSAATPQVARLLAEQLMAKGLRAWDEGHPIREHTEPKSPVRDWVARAACDLDPAPVTLQHHQIGTYPNPGTWIPAPVPIGKHSYVPRLLPRRGGSGRLPSPWPRKNRGIEP